MTRTPAPASTTEVVGAPPGDVAHAFFRAAERYADRVAIRHDGAALTYTELADRVDALARRIGRDAGAVGVSLPRSADAVVAMLAVFAAGATYCPIDVGAPTPRRRALVEVTGCRLMIDAQGLHHFPRSVDGEHARWRAELPLAYVLCTSGSTGLPKPVLTTRAAIATAVAAVADLFDVRPTDCALQFASLNWDTCFEEILPTLTRGATLVIDRSSHAGSVPALLRTIAAEGVTIVNLPTAYWHAVVSFLAHDGELLPASVRLVVIGGEPVNLARLAEWHGLSMSHVRLLNTYGATETTLITHAADLTVTTSEGPIGRPLPHVVEHVMPDGELLIGGPSLAVGYGGLPEATAERFQVRDVGSGPTRYFHTGDRVQRARDGVLHHRGRVDDELKVRGIRVDPTEVESHVAAHPAVAAVAVVGVTVGDHTTLVAYIVANALDGREKLAGEVTEFLRDRVPSHLVPNRVFVVDDLVFTATGKLDRAASHAHHMPGRREAAANEPSVDRLVGIFRGVLESDLVNADSDFFDAGGDSLLATRVLSALARETGVELSFDDFVQASSPAELAKLTASRS